MLQLAIKALDATRKTSLASQKALEAEQAKFAAGRSTTLDVLIAQEAYAKALSQQNRTNANYAEHPGGTRPYSGSGYFLFFSLKTFSMFKESNFENIA